MILLFLVLHILELVLHELDLLGDVLLAFSGLPFLLVINSSQPFEPWDARLLVDVLDLEQDLLSDFLFSGINNCLFDLINFALWF